MYTRCTFIVVNGGGSSEGSLSCVTFILYKCSVWKTVRLLQKVMCRSCSLAQALVVLRVSSRLTHRDRVSETGRPCLPVSQHPDYYLIRDRFLCGGGWIKVEETGGNVIKTFSPFLMKEQLEI